jgi:hypothetical protein
VSKDFGIVIRRAAVDALALRAGELESVFGVSPIAASKDLLSFGPHFGPEAAAEFSRRLTTLGLRYVDDFYVLEFEMPEWLSLYCALRFTP